MSMDVCMCGRAHDAVTPRGPGILNSDATCRFCLGTVHGLSHAHVYAGHVEDPIPGADSSLPTMLLTAHAWGPVTANSRAGWLHASWEPCAALDVALPSPSTQASGCTMDAGGLDSDGGCACTVQLLCCSPKGVALPLDYGIALAAF